MHERTGRGFTDTQLAARAAYLLRGNDLGAMTSAAPKLYPHMWSWDAAFVAIGLAPLSVERAVLELDTLLAAQWKNGMIPHIVFAGGVDGYFPGPERWQAGTLAAHAPSGIETSGITQPPVHAIAVARILEHARRHGRTTRADVEELYGWADRFRCGVVDTTDPRTGEAKDFDLRAGTWISTQTLAVFAPLICGGLPRATEQVLRRTFDAPRFAGNPDLKYAVPPSTSPVAKDFRPRQYWRGPVWPVMTWLFSWAFARRGWAERSAMLRSEGLRQAADGSFAEYYEPFTGRPLGSMQQSWTAASVLDWLG